MYSVDYTDEKVHIQINVLPKIFRTSPEKMFSGIEELLSKRPHSHLIQEVLQVQVQHPDISFSLFPTSRMYHELARQIYESVLEAREPFLSELKRKHGVWRTDYIIQSSSPTVWNTEVDEGLASVQYQIVLVYDSHLGAIST